MATPRTRHAARLRADRRRAQARARRFAVAAVIAVLAVVTLALTAFDSESSPAVSRPAPLPVTCRATGSTRARDRGEPARAVTGRAGRRDGDRVPRERRRGARAEARRPAAQRGAPREALASDHGRVPQRPRLVPALGRAAAHARRRRGRRHGRLLADRRNRRGDSRSGHLRTHDRRRDRAATRLCSVPRRLDAERAARSRAHGRSERRGGLVEARAP